MAVGQSSSRWVSPVELDVRGSRCFGEITADEDASGIFCIHFIVSVLFQVDHGIQTIQVISGHSSPTLDG